MLADAFENFSDMCLKYIQTWSCKILSGPVIAWQEAKKGSSKVRSFNWHWYDTNNRKKGIRGICHSIYWYTWYTKADNKYMKVYDKNRELPYIQYRDVNNWYGWAMSQKLPVNNFEWIKDNSQFNEDFIKN